jgi:methylated-DNA-[protein]-cysteine S-methyltransferase
MSWLFPWTTTVSTPLGPLVVSGQGGVRRAAFVDGAELGGDDPLGVGPALQAWFDGALDALDAIPVDPEGTEHQRKVWDAVRAIPVGETRTYGELARSVGSVARAVGRANATNPAALFVPCHRVVGGGGSLVGYAHGVERKAWLLDHERGANPLLALRARGMTAP